MDTKTPIHKKIRNIGHFGTGDLELTIKDLTDFEEVKHLINEAYKTSVAENNDREKTGLLFEKIAYIFILFTTPKT